MAARFSVYPLGTDHTAMILFSGPVVLRKNEIQQAFCKFPNQATPVRAVISVYSACLCDLVFSREKLEIQYRERRYAEVGR